MTLYYTAKDIEELASQGIQQLEVGPGVTVTDFARETARQLNVSLVDGNQTSSPPTAPSPPSSYSSTTSSRDKYNKPSGCQHGLGSQTPTGAQGSAQVTQSTAGADSNTVNQLIDLMGEAVKRGE